MSGRVYLVGAGPGDPGLLTVRANELLASADVIAYDELISREILQGLSPRALKIPVGRRGDGSQAPSPELHPAVLEHARQGKRVVRLKSGDPFIFGRGGEEALVLKQAGIPFEVVPGISAALGVAAYAGIPLTHRQLSSDLALATGHHATGKLTNLTDWAALAQSGTIVLYMGARSLRENLDRLIAHGRSPDTPAAFVVAGTTPRQQVVTGTLESLPDDVRALGYDARDPALVIVGEVVTLRAEVGWFDQRPLSGRTIVVGRARPGESSLAERLRELGAHVVEAPHVRVATLPKGATVDRALSDLFSGRAPALGGLLFPGPEIVEAWFERLADLGLDLRDLARLPIVAVGERTQAALRARGLVASHVAEGLCAEGLFSWTRQFREKRLMVFTSSGRYEGLLTELARQQVSVEALPVCELVTDWDRPMPDRPDLVVLASSSVARTLLSQAPYHDVPMAAIGARTHAAALDMGAKDVIQAASDQLDDLIRLACERLQGPQGADRAPSPA